MQEVKAPKVVRALLTRLELLDKQHKGMLALQQQQLSAPGGNGGAESLSSAASAALHANVERRLCVFYLVDSVLQRIAKVWGV